MNNEYHELYYRNKLGDIIYCGDAQTEDQAEYRLEQLAAEFPQYDYFYETVQRAE